MTKQKKETKPAPAGVSLQSCTIRQDVIISDDIMDAAATIARALEANANAACELAKSIGGENIGQICAVRIGPDGLTGNNPE